MNIQTSIRQMVALKVIKQMLNDLCHEVENKYKRPGNHDLNHCYLMEA